MAMPIALILTAVLQWQPLVMKLVHEATQSHDAVARMLAIVHTESAGKATAKSPTGALGLGQTTGIARRQCCKLDKRTCGHNPRLPEANLRCAVRLFFYYQGRFPGPSLCQTVRKAVGAYNGGDNHVMRAIKRCGAKWEACVKPETMRYVPKVFEAEEDYLAHGVPGTGVC